MPEYKFVFTQEGGTSPGGALLKSGLPEDETNQEKNDVVQAFGNKVLHTAESAALQPLNSATGGLASPTYKLVKDIVSGAGKAAIGAGVAGVAIAAVKIIVDQIQNRVAQLENQAAQANEKDNALIRAGVVTHATFYERNGLAGIKEKQR